MPSFIVTSAQSERNFALALLEPAQFSVAMRATLIVVVRPLGRVSLQSARFENIVRAIGGIDGQP